MGKHAAPNGDVPDRGSVQLPHGRRRTDVAASGRPTDLDPSDSPTAPNRSRADRRRDGLLDAGEDPGRRRPAQPRPVPPGTPRTGAPGSARPAVPASPPAAAAGTPRGGGPARPAAPVRPVPAPPVPVPVGSAPAPAPAAPVSARPGPAPARPAARPRSPEPAPQTRLRLPVPPPAAAEPAAPAAPRTTVAPFQAVPTPDSGGDGPTAEPAGRAEALGRDPVDPEVLGRSPGHAIRPEAAGTGPGGSPVPTAHPAEPGPGAEPSWRSGSPSAAPGYRDWTSPSRTRDQAPPDQALLDQAPPATTAIPDRPAGARRAVAPATAAIPDRAPAGRGLADDEDDERADPSPDRDRVARSGPDTGSSTGVVGGRAAARAERQAAEAERRRAARRSGAPAPRTDEDGDGRRGTGVRRAATGLLAVAVIALVVLGVYSFTSPQAEEAARARAAEAAPTSSAVAAPSSVLPPLEVSPLPPVDAAAATPVRVPVTVLNATGVPGLAAAIVAQLGTQGWQSPGVGQYQGGDVAVTTVYYAEGDETQRQAALQLMEQFPQITGPGVRFFDVPDVAEPGLVVVATGEWRP
ncbi:hypothetical protein DQ238_16495 [Geodermatophilus sp. TF02-6]|uniref:LytR C-terminal domain-containing protein n=1 Tax=Geodermatophilus sp. TF02-6 TaxID=2250575 RepID=UPI000DEA32A0|nr:LytR C-terminal domain-containing protein [Geodermatophilus sp. TF02-6]RBY76854.1 hypothetical protein DQ238_16495 [Geodermatophilus sp. TF02-6]